MTSKRYTPKIAVDFAKPHAFKVQSGISDAQLERAECHGWQAPGSLLSEVSDAVVGHHVELRSQKLGVAVEVQGLPLRTGRIRNRFGFLGR